MPYGTFLHTRARFICHRVLQLCCAGDADLCFNDRRRRRRRRGEKNDYRFTVPGI